VQAQFRQRFAGPEFEILGDEIAFGGPGRLSSLTRRWQTHQKWNRRQYNETKYNSAHEAPHQQRIYHVQVGTLAPAERGNKFKGAAVFSKAVVGNNGNAGATGCEPLSDFAQVSDHGFLSL
jgi:hypothetical protein